MLDRAKIVDEQFTQRVSQGKFPGLLSMSSFDLSVLDKKTALDIFDSQIKSRLLDLIARQLKEKGLSFYTIGSSGHEGNAAIAEVLRLDDMAFLHYRSGGFYLQRAKKIPEHDGVRDVLLSLVAAASDPISGGRHKVFGSVALNIPPQTSTIASHLPKALGAAISIKRAKDLHWQGNLAANSLILCSFGDASFNHASAQTTLNTCSWMAEQNYPLPIIFLCEDNGIGISVPTPKDWIQKSIYSRPGIQYIYCDGLNILEVYSKTKLAEYYARVKKQPVFLHMRCVRLLGHAGSDIESQYLSQLQIEQTEALDPLLHTAEILVAAEWMSTPAIIELYEHNRHLIEAKAVEAIRLPKLEHAETIMSSIIANKKIVKSFDLPAEEHRQLIFAQSYPQLQLKRNLCQHINFALHDLMLQYPNMLIFGEDIGKKGGVYRVTADLQARFGKRRVFDTILDETTILGTAIGLAHNGFIPVPEIQFLAYLHNAEDQLRGEAATLSFFSNGQFQNPMVIRIAGLAYQKGFGGHFHNDNSIAVLRDIPGLIIACPSNGPDAAKMLRTCMRLAYQQGRVVVFLEPIALYMTKDLHSPGDNQWLFPYPNPKEEINEGEIGIYGEGSTLIITYANGYYLSRQAAKLLEEDYQIKVKILDIRWLSPLPIKSILREARAAQRILIVDEGRQTGSISEGLMTELYESGCQVPMQRIIGKDCFIPLGNAWHYLLPSKDSIVEGILALHSEQREKDVGRFIISR